MSRRTQILECAHMTSELDFDVGSTERRASVGDLRCTVGPGCDRRTIETPVSGTPQ
jgi:hypothetical protein